ncbi:MAG: hypothetical protein PHW10_03355 [Candidatus Peribacteraceae bacterium]|nr:hypothetical protein [Candidatus Peribacteraceae bacterium]
MFSFSPSPERERRLLGKVQPIEVAERLVDRLKENDSLSTENVTEMEEMLDDVKPEDQEKFEESFKRRLDTLPDTDKQKTQESLRAFASRSARTQLDSLQRKLERSNQPPAAPQQAPDLLPPQPAAGTDAAPAMPAAVADTESEEKKGWKEWVPTMEDPRKWSGKQIATASTLTLGAIGLFALWRRSRRKNEEQESNAAPQEKKGFFRRLLPWLPGIGLAALGLYFGHKWLKDQSEWYKKNVSGKIDYLEKLIKEWTNKGKDAVNAGIGATAGAGKEATDLGTHLGGMSLEAAKTLAIPLNHLRKGEGGKALEEFVNHGCQFIEKGGSFFVWWGGELIRLPANYWTEFIKLIVDEKGNYKDFCYVACSLGTLYLFNDLAANVLLNGIGSLSKYGKMNVALKFVGAPIYITRDATDLGLTLVNKTERQAAMLKLKSRVPLRRAYLKHSINKEISLFETSKSNAAFLRARKAINDLDKEIQIVTDRVRTAPKRFRSYGPRFNEEELKALEQIRGDRVRRMQEILKNLPEEALPKDACEDFVRLWEMGESAETQFTTEFGKATRGAASTNTASKAERAAATAAGEAAESEKAVAGRIGPKVAPDSSAGSGMKKAAGAEGMAEAAPEKVPAPKGAAADKPGLKVYNPDELPAKGTAAVAKGAEGATAGTKFTETLRASTKAQEALKGITLEPKLAKVLDESPAFARFFIRHLETAPDAAKVIKELSAAAKAADDASFIGKVMETEKGFNGVVKGIESGKPVAEALAQASKVSRIGKALKFSGRAIPVAGDALVCYVSVMEMFETADELERLRKQNNPNEALINSVRQRYLYQGAQLGVGAAGLGSGACLAFGVGASVATPIAFATLPAFAVLEGMQGMHEWDEKRAMAVRDWTDVDLPKRLADLRTYTLKERGGHWTEALIASAGAAEMAQSGQGREGAEFLENTLNAQKKDLEAEKVIRSIIESTTTVTVPTLVREPNGKERPLEPEEKAHIEQEVKRYTEARFQFFLSQRQDPSHPIRSEGDVVDLLMNSEYAGRLAMERPQLEAELKQLETEQDTASMKRANALRNVLNEKDPNEQAKKYGEIFEAERIENLYGELAMKAAKLKPEQRATFREEAKKEISGLFFERAQPTLINFKTRCLEELSGTLLPDGGAPHLTSDYGEMRTREIVMKQADAAVNKILAAVDDPATINTQDLRVTAEQTQNEIIALLAHPKGLWANINHAFVDPKQNIVPEQLKEKVKQGEALMRKIDANYNGSYYTKQYGAWTNSYLYVTFDAATGKWMAKYGEKDDYADPATFTFHSRGGIFSAGGAESLNTVLEKLAAINEGKDPSQ